MGEYGRTYNAKEYSWGDVGSGPFIAEKGGAASAFGLAATRANGRLGSAYTLTAQANFAAWPMANNRLLVPSPHSDLSDVP